MKAPTLSVADPTRTGHAPLVVDLDQIDFGEAFAFRSSHGGSAMSDARFMVHDPRGPLTEVGQLDPVVIGAERPSVPPAASLFTGVIEEIALYNGLLTDAEIAALEVSAVMHENNSRAR